MKHLKCFSVFWGRLTLLYRPYPCAKSELLSVASDELFVVHIEALEHSISSSSSIGTKGHGIIIHLIGEVLRRAYNVPPSSGSNLLAIALELGVAPLAL
eukprot:3745441-Karenia_brevis.AAC.1